DIEVSGYVNNNLLIEERDLCTLCANLIKNASEASQKTKDGEIRFHIEQGKCYLSMSMENSYDGKLLTDSNGEIVTSKKDNRNHGFGLRNMKEIIKKYDGKYKMNIKEQRFCTEVILKYADRSG
nr:ATP-binding protein [Eubacterium sp.]